MAKVSKVTKVLNLDLTDIPDDLKSEAKEDVGDYLVNEISDSCSRSTSPVGRGAGFKNKKDGSASRLYQEGDMLGVLMHKPVTGGVEVGIFDYDEAQKADNHCKFSSESKRTPVPRRAFIPTENESFRSDITREINTILDSYRQLDLDKDEDIDITEEEATELIKYVEQEALEGEFLSDQYTNFLFSILDTDPTGGKSGKN